MAPSDTDDGHGAADCAPAGKGGYVVRQGDSMSLIAGATGHFWSKLWDHPDNADLKAARENPEILLPGDRVTIPPIEPEPKTCATGRVHTFRRRGVPVKLGLVVRDEIGRIYAGKRYELVIGDTTYPGTTDAEGKLCEWVQPDASTGTLTVWLAEPGLPEQIRWPIQVGHVNPIQSIAGVKARLNNLGFACGAEDATLDEPTRDALRRFQTAHRLEATGEPDAATRDKLRAEHGS